MNSTEQITVSEKLLKKISKARINIQKKLLDNPVSLTEDTKEHTESAEDLSKYLDSTEVPDTWTSEYFTTQWTSARTIIIDNINKIIVKAKEKVDESITRLPNQLIAKLVTGILDTAEQTVKTMVVPIDTELSKASYEYNNVIREWRSLKSVQKQYKENQVSKETYTTEINKLADSISSYDESTAYLISLLIYLDNLTKTLDNLSELDSTDESAWNDVLNKLKTEYSVLTKIKDSFGESSTVGSLWKLLKIIIPIVASIAGAFLTAKAADIKIRKSAVNSLDEALKADGIDPDNIKEDITKLESVYSNMSEILEYALKDIYGYSMKYNKAGLVIADNNSEYDSEDIISICPVYDLSDDLGSNFDDSSIRYVLELGKDLTGAYFNVGYGNIISNNQTIGYWNNIPIKSTISGKVTDVKARHIIVESLTTFDNAESECNEVVNDLDFTDKYTPIVDKFKKISNLESYITDYMVQCRIPNVVLHSKGNGSYHINLIQLLLGKVKHSKYRLLDDYNEEMEDLVDSYKYKIKDTCSSEHVQTSCESGNTNGLKDEICGIKKQMIRDIIQYYKTGITNTKHYCADEDKSYMLVSDYINYVADESYRYDEENPYVVKQFNLIKGFIKDRLKAESVNTSDLIEEFNSRCEDLLKTKLPVSNYYSFFSGVFRNDWYIQDDEHILGISENQKNADEEYDSLYKKMYNYIINLSGSSALERDSQEFDTDKITDINAFLKDNTGSSEYSDKDKETVKNQGKARSIVKYYMMIKGLSNSNYSSYKSASGTSLKDRTRREAQQLDDIANEVIREYNKPEYLNFFDDDNLLNMFKEFMRVECPYQGTIYINNKLHQHYVYSSVADTDMNYINGNTTDAELMDRLSAKTKKSPFRLPYWLIYCAQATLVNTIVPIYWSTGLIIAGVTIPLPIIYVPIYFLSGSVSVLFGLGICGIAIWPMMAFINNTAYSTTTLLPITLAIDFIKKKLDELANSSVSTLSALVKPLILKCDDEIYQIEEDIKNVKIEISDYKMAMAGVDQNKVTKVTL